MRRCKVDIPFLVLTVWLLQTASAQDKDPDDLWEVYEKCKPLGNATWLCDPFGKLQSAPETKQSIDDLLWRMQTEVPCYCQNPARDCYRYADVPIQSGVVAALIVTTYFPRNLEETAKRIYDDAHLAASSACDNGMLFVYAMDGQKFYVLRGNYTEQTLFDSDAKSILDRSSDALETQDYRRALPQLLEQYLVRLQGPTYERRRVWETMVGIVVAVVIVALVAAVLLGLFFTRCCNKKKSLSQPPLKTKLGAKEEMKNKAVLRRVKRRQNRAVVKHKQRMEKAQGPKRLATAQKRLWRKQKRHQAKQRREQLKQGLITPSSASDEQYYVISEPGSHIYQARSTLRPNGAESPAYAVGPTGTLASTGGYGRPPPAIMYHESQAVFDHPPSPERETQRREFYVQDEEGKRIYDTPATTATLTR